MFKDTPVIKLFTHNGNYYMYDFGKNKVLQVNKETFKEISVLQEIGIKKYIMDSSKSIVNDIIIPLMNKGYFKCQTVKEVSHHCGPVLDVLLDRCVQDLVLQVTQDCNFQCRYCLFANDTQVERHHKKINMDFITAQKSVNYLYDHCKDTSEVLIGFYGGEPLLNFNLIKHLKIVKFLLPIAKH